MNEDQKNKSQFHYISNLDASFLFLCFFSTEFKYFSSFAQLPLFLLLPHQGGTNLEARLSEIEIE
jgi:hypothetical protein